MIYITGDLHGEIDIRKLGTHSWPDGRSLTKDDYLIIAGDFGLVWYPKDHPRADEQEHWLKWLSDRKWTTLFVDGNHENFDLLDAYTPGHKWGGTVSRIADSIYRLHRGQVFELDGHRFWTFGGGYSYDKERRREGISWWPQEIPNYNETYAGITNLEKANFKVDFIVTHTAPSTVAALAIKETGSIFGEPADGGERGLRDYFESVSKQTAFDNWYFGHFHLDQSFGKFRALYQDIIPISSGQKAV